MSACRSSLGRLFHSFGPAAAKHLSTYSCCRFALQRTSLMWQNAADDDLRRRPTGSRRPDRLESCRTVAGRPGWPRSVRRHWQVATHQADSTQWLATSDASDRTQDGYDFQLHPYFNAVCVPVSTLLIVAPACAQLTEVPRTRTNFGRRSFAFSALLVSWTLFHHTFACPPSVVDSFWWTKLKVNQTQTHTFYRHRSRWLHRAISLLLCN